ncbi:MAG: FAD-dependent oxidoreductase [Kiritimatiellae bacterium]|nr:FAD-dependent oxidoreductase [Kiritimatiellia bacterium]
MKREYDVIVVGGGTAGTVAAIQAGRAGASTLLVEKNAMLGGTMTVAGINYPAHFFAWGRQVIGGIGWELLCKTYAETDERLPKPSEGTRHVRIDAAIFAALADEAALAAGVDILFHAMPAAARMTKGTWIVQVCTKAGLESLRAKVLIDTTGDANAVGLAGFELVHSDIVQPGTLTFGCSGYEPDALDYAALRAASEDAIAAGELVTTDIALRDDGPQALLKKHGHNANHLHAPLADTSEGRSRVEIEGRKALLRMYRFLRKQPGLENFRIDWVCPEVGIRETVTIKGKKTITVSEYESGVVYDDAVCYAFYPIDEHLNDGKGINGRPLKEGVLPTIPRGALLPANSQFLLVAGRCLASDREANSALRVECPCMAMGQAAGAMAALSARTGIDPEEHPIDDVRAILREHGAIVPGDRASQAEPAGPGDA